MAKAVYISVSVLGGLASIFGIAGSVNGIKQRGGTFKFDGVTYSYCTWPSSPAAGLGIAGFFLILAAQITSNSCGGCVCCCAKKTSWIGSAGNAGAIICLIFSWILTIVAAIFLLDGGILNSGVVHMNLEVYNGKRFCEYPPTSPLLVGGVMSLLATALSLLFFHIVVKHSYSPSSDDLNNIHGYPPHSYHVQMPTVFSTTNSAKNNDVEFAFPAISPSSYHTPIPVGGARYY